MERSITLPVFIELSLSLLGFLLLVSVFFRYGNTERHTAVIDSSRVNSIEVLQLT